VNVLVRFLDVGQGDCTLVIDRDLSLAAVIDCPAGGLATLEAELASASISRPDLVVITHSDIDHMAGAVSLLRSRGAREVRWNADHAMPTDPTERIQRRAALRALADLPDRGVVAGPATDDLVGSLGAVRFRCLSPSHAMVSRAQAEARPNHASAIVRLEIGDVVLLVAGDADGAAWRRLIDAGADLRATVFRVPHHGGAIAFAPTDVDWAELLDAVMADIHVVSVGTVNRYGHPIAQALAALGARAPRARVMCTQVNPVCAGSSPLPRSGAGLPTSSLAGLGGRPGACRCAGSISIDFADEGWTVSPKVAEHQQVISALETPVCVA
jgi:competence protein ComEC